MVYLASQSLNLTHNYYAVTINCEALRWDSFFQFFSVTSTCLIISEMVHRFLVIYIEFYLITVLISLAKRLRFENQEYLSTAYSKTHTFVERTDISFHFPPGMKTRNKIHRAEEADPQGLLIKTDVLID